MAEVHHIGRDFIADLTSLVYSKSPFTDIRLEQDAPVAVRMPAGWMEVESIQPPSVDDLSRLLANIEGDWEEEIKKAAISRPFDLSEWRLRINAYLAGRGHLAMAIRRIPHTPPNLKAVGLPAIVRIMLSASRGLLLITGATRSGKSTSAAAMIEVINESRSAHIVTIEDPIEYVFKNKRAIFSQREVGVDTPSFEIGLEDAMRQCPDVILVGEIRNRETAEIALLAGESGHLVIGTMHANTGVGSIQKILGWFNDNERNSKLQSLAGSLVGIVNQVLLPTADKSGYALATEILNNYEQDFSAVLGDPQKMQSIMDRPDKKGSIHIAESLADLVNNGAVETSDAVKALAGMSNAQQKLRQLLK